MSGNVCDDLWLVEVWIRSLRKVLVRESSMMRVRVKMIVR